MSRVANAPVAIGKGIEVSRVDGSVVVKGPKGTLSFALPQHIDVAIDDGVLRVTTPEGYSGREPLRPIAGTTRAIINNMVYGVEKGFERRLTLVGVGYRAQAQGSTLTVNVGYSHPVEYHVPDGITVETPKQTEIVVNGIDKHQVGQVAANIRAFRPPEPYKGKGIRYADEVIIQKEAKKK